MDVIESPEPKNELSDEAVAARENHDQVRQDRERDTERAEHSARLGHDIREPGPERPSSPAEEVIRTEKTRTEELRTEETPSEPAQGEVQTEEVRTEEVQTEESQTQPPQTESTPSEPS